MPSFTNIITSLACLMAVTNAMPANVARQHSTDCTDGESYYVCGDHKGCFAKDPCFNISGPTSTTTAKVPVTTTTKAPETTATMVPDTEAQKCTLQSGESIRHLPVAIYNVFPQHPSLHNGMASGIHLETYDNASQVEQVLVFRDIPSDAKSCNFGWSQGDRVSRTFIVKGVNGVSDIQQLTGLPTEEKGITYNSIRQFQQSDRPIGGIDFTNWDENADSTHNAGSVECADVLYFKVALRNGDGNTQVFLKEDSFNGYYISYSC